MEHWRVYNPQPQCDDCGRFIPYSRARLEGKFEPPPTVGWVEWWSGRCAKCEAAQG